jgi:hypothetical protein
MMTQELLGISSYVQLLDVMEKLRGQLSKDIESTENKLPILRQNLVRIEKALAVLKSPVKQRRGGDNSSYWTPEHRAAAAERMRAKNAARKAAREGATEVAR